jgi:hypothetical protein
MHVHFVSGSTNSKCLLLHKLQMYCLLAKGWMLNDSKFNHAHDWMGIFVLCFNSLKNFPPSLHKWNLFLKFHYPMCSGLCTKVPWSHSKILLNFIRFLTSPTCGKWWCQIIGEDFISVTWKQRKSHPLTLNLSKMMKPCQTS